jgi:hypothetical protein
VTQPSPQPVTQPSPQPVRVVVTRTEPEPGTTVSPAPVPVAQCLNVTAPPSVAVGGVVAFRASLCAEDGTAVSVRFRPRGSPAWETQSMPLRLGAHTQTLSVSERFATGIEYYVFAGDQSYGSPTSPRFIEVSGG